MDVDAPIETGALHAETDTPSVARRARFRVSERMAALESSRATRIDRILRRERYDF